jgi:hypothetical protein
MERKRNTIRKWRPTRKRLTHPYPIFTFRHFHIFCRQLGSLCMLFDLFFPSIICPPPSPFSLFFIAIPKLSGIGFQFLYFLIISGEANISFQDRCTSIVPHRRESTLFALLLVCFHFLFYNDRLSNLRPTVIRTWTCTQLDGHALPPFFYFHSDECLDREK